MDFDRRMLDAWQKDELDKLPVGTPVRVDLSYLAYDDRAWLLSHGHGLEGNVTAVWKEIDGFYAYDVGGEGAFPREALVDLNAD
jgi:hypothetical protein